MSSLSDVTILVTSFLRFGYLEGCLEGIERNLRECDVVTVDDSGPSKEFEQLAHDSIYRDGNQFWFMDFDSGLSAKRNLGVKAVCTKYVLLGCDDFDFSTKEAREGIEKMVKVLDENPNTLDLVAGRVNNQPYEGFLEYVHGEYIKETRLNTEEVFGGDMSWKRCDLTVNYFLARTEILKRFPWDETITPIGGEHGDFFLTLKENRRRVAWVRGVNVNTFPHDPSKIDPRYPELRARAVTHGHRIFMEKRNIKQYIGF